MMELCSREGRLHPCNTLKGCVATAHADVLAVIVLVIVVVCW